MKRNSYVERPYLIDRITDIRTTISNRTEVWFRQWSKLKKFEERVSIFDVKYKDYTKSTIQMKSVWFFLLFMGLPGMLILDYTGLKNFCEWMGYRVSGSLQPALTNYGFILFGVIELFIGVYIIKTNKAKNSGRASRSRIFTSYLIMVAIIVMPSALILVGYFLDVSKTAQLPKTIILMALSLVIHTLIFLCIESLWKSIEYFFNYLPTRVYFAWVDPKNELIKLRPILRENYIEYDKTIFEFRELPYESQKNLNYKLDRRDLLLREKLTSSTNDDDFDFPTATAIIKEEINAEPAAKDE
jgi:hypothetical protein